MLLLFLFRIQLDFKELLSFEELSDVILLHKGRRRRVVQEGRCAEHVVEKGKRIDILKGEIKSKSDTVSNYVVFAAYWQ